jgi:hypothetical protein
VVAEFVHRTQQSAVFGNAGSLHGGSIQLVAQHAHHLVVHLEQGVAQQGGAGFAQMRVRAESGQGGQFLPVLGHAQFLQRTQCIDWLAEKRDADPEWTQAFELRGHVKALGGVDRHRGEDNFHLGVHARGQRGDRGFRVGELEEQAAEAEVTNFAGDAGMPRLRDDGRLRDLEAPVAPHFLTAVLHVCAVRHHSAVSLIFAAIIGPACSGLFRPGDGMLKAGWHRPAGFGRLRT